MIVSYTEPLNLNKTTSYCNKIYVHIVYEWSQNGKCALIPANLLHLDVTEYHLHLYLHSCVLNDRPTYILCWPTSLSWCQVP